MGGSGRRRRREAKGGEGRRREAKGGDKPCANSGLSPRKAIPRGIEIDRKARSRAEVHEPSGEVQPSARGRLRAADVCDVEPTSSPPAAGGRSSGPTRGCRPPHGAAANGTHLRATFGQQLAKGRNEPCANSGPSPPKAAARRATARTCSDRSPTPLPF